MDITQVDNLDNNIYHNSEKYSEYWSSSNIKKYMETPREAKFQKDKTEHDETKAMNQGSKLHDYLASKHIKGQKFDYNIFEAPVHLTGKYKGQAYGYDTKAYQEAAALIHNPITADEMELINDIWAMVRKSDYSWYFEKEILGKGIAEPSFFVDGLHKYKYRPDVLTDKYIFDYKSVAKMKWTAKDLNTVVTNRGYDISAAMYQYFEHVRSGIWKPFILIWLMKEPPFDILIHDISPYCYEPFGNNEVIVNSGANVFLKLKEQHELCQVTEQWPGLANQFDKWSAIRMAQFSPRYENNFDSFEIDNKR